MTLHLMASFQSLQPVLERLSIEPSDKDLNELNEIIPNISPLALQKLHEMILIPLINHVLNPQIGNEMKCQILHCAHGVFLRAHITDFKNVQKLMNALMMLLFDRSTPSLIRDVPEELKLNVMKCVLAIVSNMTEEAQDKFYVKENIPNISQIACISVQLVETEKLRPLRICAMNLLLALAQAPKEGSKDNRSPYERKVIADIFQFILPGATSKLFGVISGDSTQGSKAILTAVRTLSYIIALVMEDYFLSESNANLVKTISMMSESSHTPNVTSPAETIGSPQGAKDMQNYLSQSEGRTPEWRKKTARLLVPYISSLASQHAHSNWKVRMEVARGAHLIILRCLRSLREGLPTLMDSLVVLALDEMESVKRCSLDALHELSHYFSDQSEHSFLELAEENLYVLLTKLPQLVQEEGGAKCLQSLALLSGYVRLLQPSMNLVLSSSIHLQRFTLSLLYAITLDSTFVPVSFEHTTRELTANIYKNATPPWINLRFSPDGGAFYQLQVLCSLLADPKCNALDILGQQVLSTLTEIPQLRKECVFLLNTLLSATSKFRTDSTKQLGCDVLETYLVPEFWQHIPERSNKLNLQHLKHNTLLKCLLAEGIGCCVEALGEEKTKHHLLCILYPLLECAGSSQNLVSLAGSQALTKVAAICGYGQNIMKFIAANMDYVAYHMTTKLKHPEYQSGVFDALNLVLQHASPEIALGLQDIVQNVLQQNKDLSRSNDAQAHLRVFLTFARGVSSWLKPPSVDLEADIITKSNPSEMFLNEDSPYSEMDVHFSETKLLQKSTEWSVVPRLKKYCEDLKLDCMCNDLEAASTQNDCNIELDKEKHPHILAERSRQMEYQDGEVTKDDEEKEKIPELAKLLVLVLQRSLNFLPTHVLENQLLALQILCAGLHGLKAYPNSLLPIAHQTWAPLLGRFQKDQSPLIMRAAFQLLSTLAHCAKDFLRSRTLREVIPQLSDYLQATQKQSFLQDQGSVYRFSQHYKLQLSLLSGLGPLACHLELKGVDFYPILTSSIPYLSSKQPKPLQNTCISLLTCLKDLDKDAVWWALVTFWTPAGLTSILKFRSDNSHEDCQKNIHLILESL